MSNTITRMSLVNALHNETGLAQSDCADLLEAVLNRMSDALANGEPLKISSFATFSVRHKKERVGRNPETGEEASISARNVVDFKASQVLKARVDRSLNCIRWLQIGKSTRLVGTHSNL